MLLNGKRRTQKYPLMWNHFAVMNSLEAAITLFFFFQSVKVQSERIKREASLTEAGNFFAIMWNAADVKYSLSLSCCTSHVFVFTAHIPNCVEYYWRPYGNPMFMLNVSTCQSLLRVSGWAVTNPLSSLTGSSLTFVHFKCKVLHLHWEPKESTDICIDLLRVRWLLWVDW